MSNMEGSRNSNESGCFLKRFFFLGSKEIRFAISLEVGLDLGFRGGGVTLPTRPGIVRFEDEVPLPGPAVDLVCGGHGRFFLFYFEFLD